MLEFSVGKDMRKKIKIINIDKRRFPTYLLAYFLHKLSN